MDAAAGIYRIVNENMAAAARIYIAEKGHDASRLTLVCSGGAGPVHAVDLARKLGIRKVVVPPFSGVMSSLGLLTAPLAFERSRTIHQLLDEARLADIDAIFRELESSAAQFLPDASQLTFERTLEVRYLGQDYALEIAARRDAFNENSRHQWKADFFAAYEEQYGTVDDENPIELAALKVRVSQQPAPPSMQIARGKRAAVPKTRRKLYVVNTGRLIEVGVYERAQLSHSQDILGPAVIEERESTTVIGDGDSLTVDQYGCLVVTLRRSREHMVPRAKLVESVEN
jgi:N-methylhydantoinase A/oxoprolinase/acetone carboxylase beta subunit